MEVPVVDCHFVDITSMTPEGERVLDLPSIHNREPAVVVNSDRRENGSGGATPERLYATSLCRILRVAVSPSPEAVHWGCAQPTAAMGRSTVVGFEVGSNDRLRLQAATASDP